jgi:hypothetical protein
LRAPCLLAPRHPAVKIGCGVYARVGGPASRQQCADEYCCKQSTFRFHHGYLPYQDAIGNGFVIPTKGGIQWRCGVTPAKAGIQWRWKTLDFPLASGMTAKPQILLTCPPFA